MKYKHVLIVFLSVVVFSTCKKEDDEVVPPDEQYGTGLLPDLPPVYSSLPVASLPPTGTLPSSYELDMPPAGNQGQQGSCVAWAVAFGLKSYQMKTANNLSYTTSGSLNTSSVCSPSYVYNQIKAGGCSAGSYITSAFDLVKAQGVCTLAQMDYDADDCDTQPTTSQIGAAASNKFSAYETVPFNVAAFKTAIFTGNPVVIGARLNCDFRDMQADGNGNFIWDNADVCANYAGNHAMIVYGWDDDLDALKVLNSWGQNWADEGDFWLSYDILDDVVFQAYIGHDQSNNGTRIISLSGNLSFGDVTVNTTASRTLRIFNSGTADLTILDIDEPNGFDADFTGSATIASNDYLDVDISFSPLSAGSYSGQISVTSNATSGSSTISVSGNGIGGASWQCGDNLIDSRDGEVYQTVEIGGQCWMKENLNASAGIAEVTDDAQWENFGDLTTPAWCYHSNSASNGVIYGKLYNGYAVISGGLCPNGWHMPTDTEWQTLVDELGGSGVAGGKMKSNTGWNAPNTGATNSSLFTALPGGVRDRDGNFCCVGIDGIFWSNTEDGSLLWVRNVAFDNSGVGRANSNKGNGYSCRCVKD